MNHHARRFVLKAGTSTLGLALFNAFGWSASLAHAAEPGKFEVTHTDAEWRKLLTPNQYAVLRQRGHRAARSPAR